MKPQLKASTNAFGEFFLSRVDPGAWKVSYKAPRAPWAAGYTHLADAVVHPGETTKLVLYVPGQYKLTGHFVLGKEDSGSVLRLRLLDIGGVELGHAQAINLDPSMGSRQKPPPEQQPGYFEFAGLPGGIYRLVIQPMMDLEGFSPEIVKLITVEMKVELRAEDVVLPLRQFDWLKDFHME